MISDNILIAMSGGVDSAVAALLARDARRGSLRDAGRDSLRDARRGSLYDAECDSLCDAGRDREFNPAIGAGRGETRDAHHDCAAVTLWLVDNASAEYDRDMACDIAARLGMPFSVLDLRDAFHAEVIDPFVASYLDGATPNPCVRCNRRIKFGSLLDYADERGFFHVATGHFARVERDPATSRYLLKKGDDAPKDQSYMLYSLTQRQLSRAMFPLGRLSKAEVREIALSNGFPNANRRESQDICFINEGGYADFIERHTRTAQGEGPIIDESGQIIGKHKGAVRYTVGQRKGLGLAMPEPVYVYAKSMAENIIYAGGEHLLYKKTLTAHTVNLIPFERVPGRLDVTAQTRYRQPERRATIEQIGDDEIRVEFEEPQKTVARGQSVVFYDGDVVVGGGIIS